MTPLAIVQKLINEANEVIEDRPIDVDDNEDNDDYQTAVASVDQKLEVVVSDQQQHLNQVESSIKEKKYSSSSASSEVVVRAVEITQEISSEIEIKHPFASTSSISLSDDKEITDTKQSFHQAQEQDQGADLISSHQDHTTLIEKTYYFAQTDLEEDSADDQDDDIHFVEKHPLICHSSSKQHFESDNQASYEANSSSTEDQPKKDGWGKKILKGSALAVGAIAASAVVIPALGASAVIAAGGSAASTISSKRAKSSTTTNKETAYQVGGPIESSTSTSSYSVAADIAQEKQPPFDKSSQPETNQSLDNIVLLPGAVLSLDNKDYSTPTTTLQDSDLDETDRALLEDFDRAVPIQGCHGEQTNPTITTDVDVIVVEESKINIKAGGTSTFQIKTPDTGLEYSTTTKTSSCDIIKEDHTELVAGELAPGLDLNAASAANLIQEKTTTSAKISRVITATELASDYLGATREATAPAIIQEPSELASEIKISDTTTAAIASIACLEADIDDDPVTRDSQEPKLSNKADSRTTKLVVLSSEEQLIAGKGLQDLQEPSVEEYHHIIDEELVSKEEKDHHKLIDDSVVLLPAASLTSDPPAVCTRPFVERIEPCLAESSTDSVIVKSLKTTTATTTTTNTFKVSSSSPSSSTYQCQADNNKTEEEDFKEESLSRKKEEEDKHFNPDVESKEEPLIDYIAEHTTDDNIDSEYEEEQPCSTRASPVSVDDHQKKYSPSFNNNKNTHSTGSSSTSTLQPSVIDSKIDPPSESSESSTLCQSLITDSLDQIHQSSSSTTSLAVLESGSSLVTDLLQPKNQRPNLVESIDSDSLEPENSASSPRQLDTSETCLSFSENQEVVDETDSCQIFTSPTVEFKSEPADISEEPKKDGWGKKILKGSALAVGAIAASAVVIPALGAGAVVAAGGSAASAISASLATASAATAAGAGVSAGSVAAAGAAATAASAAAYAASSQPSDLPEEEVEACAVTSEEFGTSNVDSDLNLDANSNYP